MSRKPKAITEVEISEMEKMLRHIHFSINKTIPVKIKMINLTEQYHIRNNRDVCATLQEQKLIKKFGSGVSPSYLWVSPEEPSKIMARRIIKQTMKRRAVSNKVAKAKMAAEKVSNSEEKITREEFEKRVEKINKETGMYAEEFKKIKELKGKQIKVEQPQPKHVEPIQKQETESVSLFWGLYTRTKNI